MHETWTSHRPSFAALTLLVLLGCNNLTDVSGDGPTITPGECLADEMVCDGRDDDCDGVIDEELTNPCGGCMPLVELGEACGDCGTMVCDGADSLLCDDEGLNSCGLCGSQSLCPTCDSDADCTVGACVEGACVPEGFVVIDPGTFVKGSPSGEPGRDASSEELREVTITRRFVVQTTEVTEGQWHALMGNHISYDQRGADYPAEHMTWIEALRYLNALSERDGLQQCYALSTSCPNGGCEVSFVGLECGGYRLLTDAEWEYAARATTVEATHNGRVDIVSPQDCGYDELGNLDAIAWYCATTEEKRETAQLMPNAWGLYDVSGNVAEWVWDAFNAQYEDSSTDPVGALSFTCDRNVGGQECDRSDRGGGFGDGAKWCRSAARHHTKLYEDRGTLGFRVARTIQ